MRFAVLAVAFRRPPGGTYSTTGRFSRDGRRYWPIVTMSTRASRRRREELRDLVSPLPESEHEARLRRHRRVEILRRRQQRQRALEARAPAHVAVQPRHGLDVVVEDVGLRRDDGFDRRRGGRGSRASGLRHRAAGASARTARIVSAKCAAPPSGRSSRSTDVRTTNCRDIRCDGRAHADGLQRVDRERLAVGDVAETAGPRADVAEQEEGRRAAGETLAAVRAARLFADRVEPVRAHDGS